MTRYYLGVDIGATKSHALIADETGRAVGFGAAGPGNHEVVGYDGLIAALGECTGQALAMAGIDRREIAGAGFGVGGYDWPGERGATLDAIAHFGADVSGRGCQRCSDRAAGRGGGGVGRRPHLRDGQQLLGLGSRAHPHGPCHRQRDDVRRVRRRIRSGLEGPLRGGGRLGPSRPRHAAHRALHGADRRGLPGASVGRVEPGRTAASARRQRRWSFRPRMRVTRWPPNASPGRAGSSAAWRSA